MKHSNLVDNNLFPSPPIAVTYEDIFGEQPKQTSIEGLMTELPMIVVLHHILKRQLSVHFTMYARQPQDKLLDELCNDLKKADRTRLSLLSTKNGRG